MDNFFDLDEPIVNTTTITVKKYRYELMDLKPHLGVSYQIWCYNSDDIFVKHFTGKIEGEEYENWSTDDKYIDDLIKSKVLEYFTNE